MFKLKNVEDCFQNVELLPSSQNFPGDGAPQSASLRCVPSDVPGNLAGAPAEGPTEWRVLRLVLLRRSPAVGGFGAVVLLVVCLLPEQVPRR